MTCTDSNCTEQHLVAVDNPEWVKDCLHWRGRILTGEMRHWCFDWDELPVDETTPDEMDCCTCFRS